MAETIRIAMWSGPRNISTAMMRAWGSRADCHVMDEPFYGAYLATSGVDHPMREAILAAHETDWDRCAATCAATSTAAGQAPIVYQKHMTQHMLADAPMDWTDGARHAFLIRPPGEVAASFHQKWAGMSAEDLGFHRQAELFDQICQRTGSAPPVIAARDVLDDPGAMLPLICGRLGVPWDPAMLSWAPGRRSTDGVWAAHWYGAVEASTGFAPPAPPKASPPGLDAIVDACRDAYLSMAKHRMHPPRRSDPPDPA